MIEEGHKKYFPFNYRFITQREPVPADEALCIISKPVRIETIQNDNAFFDAFYKNISRF